MSLRWAESGTLRVLDLDIETRRIGFHSAGRFAPDGCEPVAIAACWVGQERVVCWHLPEYESQDMLFNFRALWDEADLVTGHYLTKFDIPILNGALFEHGLPLLTPKLVCDTKTDLVKRAGLSASQENLSLMLRLERDKFHMSDHNWRGVARLEPEAMENCRRRVIDDVRQHIMLRQRLIEAGALKSPRVWRP